MSDNHDGKKKLGNGELEGKNVAYYQTLLSAWIETRIEQDKMVITLSAAAIGLLVTIFTAVGIKGFWQYLFAIISFFGFLIATCSCLHIFQVNARHLEENLRCQSTDDTSKLLEKLDKTTIVAFYSGIVFAILMALCVSFQKTGDSVMSNQNEKATKKTEKLNESLKGIKKLSPDQLEIGKSLNGVGRLAPQNLQTSTTKPQQDSNKTLGGTEQSASKDK